MNNLEGIEGSGVKAATTTGGGGSFYRRLLAASALSLLVAGAGSAQEGSAHRQSAGAGHSLVAASEPAPSRAGTYYGEPKPFGGGQIRSWVKLDRDGKPLALGLSFTEEALKGLPAELPRGQEGTEVLLALPPEASPSAFNHIGVDWNPHGHVPEKIYDVPHFDFHFYLISPEERGRITAQGEDLARSRKQPPPDYVPAGYIYAPASEVPRMGGHWVDPQSNEFNKQPFTRTFLYGNYNGQIIFMEPMITKAFLEARTNVTEVIKLPSKYARPGYYPTRYSVKYDPAAKEYSVALEGMTLR
jgi:Hypothetical protein TTHB210